MAEKAGVTMSVEGFLLRRKRYRTKHNMFQLVSDVVDDSNKKCGSEYDG